MAYFRYTAKRSLISGVSVNDVIELRVGLQSANPVRDRQGKTHVSYGSTRFHRVFSVDQGYDIAMIPVLTSENRAIIKMFLDSVEHGEEFDFDFNDSGLSLSQYTLESSYRERRNPGNIYEFSFRMFLQQ